MLQLLLIVGLLASAGYGFWEIRRWSTPIGSESVTPKQRRLRAWGLFFLLASLGLWLGVTYLPKPKTQRAKFAYLEYLTLIALAAVPLIPLALLDSRESLRQMAEARKRLLQETLAPLSKESPEPPSSSPA